jgi:hypothetical protein
MKNGPMNSVIRTGNNPTPVSRGANPSKKIEQLRMLELVDA